MPTMVGGVGKSSSKAVRKRGRFWCRHPPLFAYGVVKLHESVGGARYDSPRSWSGNRVRNGKAKVEMGIVNSFTKRQMIDSSEKKRTRTPAPTCLSSCRRLPSRLNSFQKLKTTYRKGGKGPVEDRVGLSRLNRMKCAVRANDRVEVRVSSAKTASGT